jgi:hypothetical protein
MVHQEEGEEEEMRAASAARVQLGIWYVQQTPSGLARLSEVYPARHLEHSPVRSMDAVDGSLGAVWAVRVRTLAGGL